MRAETLEHLSCPAPGCAGGLFLSAAVKPWWSAPDKAELLEAVLRCEVCGSEYPVLLGVAVLETDLGSYLAAFWDEIESCEAGLEVSGVSPEMRAWLGAPGTMLGRRGPVLDGPASSDWSTAPYLQSHYDRESLPGGLPDGWWRQAVELHGGTVDPYGYLLDAARRLGNAEQDGLAVEVGTSVGRGAAALAELYAYSLGVDRSFPAVLAARRLLLESPEPLHAYRLETERGRWEQRRLQPPPGGERLDYLAGSGAELPLTGGQAACVAALNVLCAVADPASLVSEFSRVLEPGGLLLVASPYWSDAGDGDGQWAGPESLRRLLAGDFDVVAEEDMVPWLLRLARRRWNVYLSHCVVATRR